MEVLALAPLHLLLGVTNKVYKEVCPGDATDSFGEKQEDALMKHGIRRSAYFQGDLEGNECSKFLDAVADGKIPFRRKRDIRLRVEALKAFKVVKDRCFGLQCKLCIERLDGKSPSSTFELRGDRVASRGH
ncbi:hypothetical protein FOZ63_018852 [Perkinsus olseni]|uniref:Uncharacterized protein n=1 Tax=Perkinsus olseni TaxID=32597 RepID=A0A7J6RJ96_PEROL|nr:hypothetical protein FOZ62_024378 [Perkinsus olseni]KAF4727673.1 hypothetical protein FOZ63_018852 [Perkinsus olseni]